MAITNKEQGVWGLDQVYNKINQGSIWEYSGVSQAMVWGYNQRGTLGQNNIIHQSSPVQLPGTTWRKFNSAAYNGYLATKTDGTLWAWGENQQGECGQNNINPTGISSPTQIGSGTDWTDNICYGRTCFAIKTDGTLWGWGNNLNGKLGLNQATSTQYSSPVQIPGTTWSNITCHNYTIATKTDGTLWSWGYNYGGSLGLNQGSTGADSRSSPTQIGTDTDWGNSKLTINKSEYAAMVLKSDNTLWTWGLNQSGILGQGQGNYHPGVIADRSSPVQIMADGLFSDVSQGNSWAGALKTDGTLWAWGANFYGQTIYNKGFNGAIWWAYKYASSPVQVPGTDWRTIECLTGSWQNTKTDGTLWSWGYNQSGVLGQNQAVTVKISSPVQVGTDTDWVDAYGSQNSAVVTRNL